MSQQPINLSPDLLRLRNEGYDISVVGGYLLVRNVPYVNSDCVVQSGILICRLDLSGDKANKPSDHAAYWTGEHPCHADGSKITEISNPSPPQDLGDGIHADFTFSAKADYRDYHHKVTTYTGRITGEASKVKLDATAQIFPAMPEESPDAVFNYIDTASSRAKIGRVNRKLAGLRVGIVGLGGTGAYVLDLVAKTWVTEIHLFDGDIYSQHNAFRAPGAPTLEQLQARLQKVVYHAQTYSHMHNGIVTHDEYLCESNLDLLDSLDFVFLCIDTGNVKRLIVNRLSLNQAPFVDVGMGISFYGEDRLGGIVRVVTSTPENRALADCHISYADDNGGNNDYETNIQIAELNSLNAALAIIEWKKYFGVYSNLGTKHYIGYSIASGELSIESGQ